MGSMDNEHSTLPVAIGTTAPVLQRAFPNRPNTAEAASVSEALQMEGLARWSRNHLCSLDLGNTRRHGRLSFTLPKVWAARSARWSASGNRTWKTGGLLAKAQKSG